MLVAYSRLRGTNKYGLPAGEGWQQVMRRDAGNNRGQCERTSGADAQDADIIREVEAMTTIATQPSALRSFGMSWKLRERPWRRGTRPLSDEGSDRHCESER